MRKGENNMTDLKEQKKQVFTADEVQRAALDNARQANVQLPKVTQSAAWRNVQAGGNAKQQYQALQAAKPGAYQSAYQGEIQDTLNQLLNRKPYQYDVNADGLYQQIKDNYIKQGKQAMMDVQGQSAALTGGYGNSYGATAGSQAYQEYLTKLSDRIPELAQMAYNRDQDAENGQRSNLSLLLGMDDTAYSRYLQDVSAYDQALENAYKKYQQSMAGSGRRGLTLEQFRSLTGDMREMNGTHGEAAMADYINGMRKDGIIDDIDAAALSAAMQNYASGAAQVNTPTDYDRLMEVASNVAGVEAAGYNQQAALDMAMMTGQIRSEQEYEAVRRFLEQREEDEFAQLLGN